MCQLPHLRPGDGTPRKGSRIICAGTGCMTGPRKDPVSVFEDDKRATARLLLTNRRCRGLPDRKGWLSGLDSRISEVKKAEGLPLILEFVKVCFFTNTPALQHFSTPPYPKNQSSLKGAHALLYNNRTSEGKGTSVGVLKFTVPFIFRQQPVKPGD